MASCIVLCVLVSSLTVTDMLYIGHKHIYNINSLLSYFSKIAWVRYIGCYLFYAFRKILHLNI